MNCIHPSQRCISSRKKADNIFGIETITLAHVACAPQDSGVLLTDFAAAYPSVNHFWIFSVLENTGLPDFLCRFFTKHLQGQHHTHGICREQNEDNSLWPQEYDKAALRVAFFLQWPLTPIFRWLQESIIPTNVDNLEFLQPAQCAYADDLAAASSSFRELMVALTLLASI